MLPAKVNICNAITYIYQQGLNASIHSREPYQQVPHGIPLLGGWDKVHYKLEDTFRHNFSHMMDWPFPNHTSIWLSSTGQIFLSCIQRVLPGTSIIHGRLEFPIHFFPGFIIALSWWPSWLQPTLSMSYHTGL